MTFADAIASLRLLEGEEVEVYARGIGDKAAITVSLSGTLTEVAAETPSKLRTSVILPVTFEIGSGTGAHLSLWADRYTGGEVVGNPEGIVFSTKDGVIEVRRKGFPWID